MAVDRSPSSPSPTYCTGRPIRRRYATVLSRRPRQRLTSVGCGVPARGSRYLGNRRCPRTPPTVRRTRGHALASAPRIGVVTANAVTTPISRSSSSSARSSRLRRDFSGRGLPTARPRDPFNSPEGCVARLVRRKHRYPAAPGRDNRGHRVEHLFFSYQSAVLVTILGLDVVNVRELVRMTTVYSVVTLVVLLPIQLIVFVIVF